MLFLGLALLAFNPFVSANVTFKDCGHAEVIDLEISGCVEAPCTLHKGGVTEIDVTFKANANNAKANIKLIAIIGGLSVEVPGVDTDGCKYMTPACPLVAGNTYTIKYKYTVPSIAPSVEADVKLELQTDSGADLFCGTVHGKITS